MAFSRDSRDLREILTLSLSLSISSIPGRPGTVSPTKRPRPHSLLPIPYSLFPTPYSLFPTPYSLLPTPYSLFPTPYPPYPPLTYSHLLLLLSVLF